MFMFYKGYVAEKCYYCYNFYYSTDFKAIISDFMNCHIFSNEKTHFDHERDRN
jgi:hypothetical protein